VAIVKRPSMSGAVITAFLSLFDRPMPRDCPSRRGAIGVYRSDRRSRVGKLTRQGSPQLRWALFEAAQSACRSQSPDHADYLALKARGLSHTRASMTIARSGAAASAARASRSTRCAAADTSSWLASFRIR